MRFSEFTQKVSESEASLANTVDKLKFGQEIKMSLNDFGLSEAKGQDKGANGRIAEYACAFQLAHLLRANGLNVRSDVERLKDLAELEAEKYSKSLTPQEIQVAIQAGNKMAESMFNSIIDNGKDLVFTNYEFIPQQHDFEITPTGAAQNKGSTDDMVIEVSKDGNKEVAKRILLSLKVSASEATSQGSKSPLPLLWHLFVDPSKKTVKAKDFIEVFGPKGKEFVDALTDFKNAGREFLKSPEGQEWAKAKEQERIGKGKSAKSVKVKADTNFFRSKEVGDYYTKTRGYTSEHKLSKLFVELYENGKKNLNGGDWKRFNEGFKQAIGFDDVITYKAICNKQGVTNIVSSATSPAYQAMYRALENQIDVVLTSSGESGGIGVVLKYGDTVLDSLSCSIWKEGTIQFKFKSAPSKATKAEI
jgi:hypothetical protein